MKVYLLDINPRMTKAWEKYFGQTEEVEIVNEEFGEFMNGHSVECVVSPANAYGLMDGGYDLAISHYFGWELQKKVQRYILDNFFGEQPVGTSILIETGKDGIKLIHTPTMRYPDKIRDPLVVYHCMRTCLMKAKEYGVKSIVIPAFGGSAGEVPTGTIAAMMWRAWDQINHPPKEIDWGYADRALFFYFGSEE